MKKMIIILIISALMTTLFYNYIYSQTTTPIIANVDGKKFRILTIKQNNAIFLDAEQLSRCLNLTIKDGPGSSIYLNDRLIIGVITHENKKYVNADAFAKAFGYQIRKGKARQIVFSSSGDALTTGGLIVEIAITSKQRSETSNPNEVMYTLKVSFRNIGKTAVRFTNNNLFLEDDAGKKYRVSRLGFAQPIDLQPYATAESDRIYYVVPRDTDIKYLKLIKGKTVIGMTSF